jgi:hypothetical protein
MACLKRAMVVVDVERAVQTDKGAQLDALLVEHREKGRARRRGSKIVGPRGERLPFYITSQRLSSSRSRHLRGIDRCRIFSPAEKVVFDPDLQESRKREWMLHASPSLCFRQIKDFLNIHPLVSSWNEWIRQWSLTSMVVFKLSLRAAFERGSRDESSLESRTVHEQ